MYGNFNFGVYKWWISHLPAPDMYFPPLKGGAVIFNACRPNREKSGLAKNSNEMHFQLIPKAT